MSCLKIVILLLHPRRAFLRYRGSREIQS